MAKSKKRARDSATNVNPRPSKKSKSSATSNMPSQVMQSKKRSREEDPTVDLPLPNKVKSVEAFTSSMPSQLEQSNKRPREDDDITIDPTLIKKIKNDVSAILPDAARSPTTTSSTKGPSAEASSTPALSPLASTILVLSSNEDFKKYTDHPENQNPPLRTLPPELRLKIFEHCVVGEWTGRNPAILRALRYDSILYQECLSKFHEANHTYFVNSRNGWGFCQMKESVIQSIKKLKVEIK